MINKILSLLVVAAISLGVASCNSEQIPPNESLEAPPENEPALPIPKSIQPTEDINTSDTFTPINSGLWRFESEPEVVDGNRIYLAYVWFAAKNDHVILTRSSTAGIKSQDFGLCDQRWKGDDSPFLETKEGNRYLPGIIGCEYAFFTDPLLILYPDI